MTSRLLRTVLDKVELDYSVCTNCLLELYNRYRSALYCSFNFLYSFFHFPFLHLFLLSWIEFINLGVREDELRHLVGQAAGEKGPGAHPTSGDPAKNHSHAIPASSARPTG
jgi:hypothetical protein